MKTNHQMNYYDYAKTLSAEGVMTALICVGDEQHEYIDLGLPSRTLWATCNIGANTPEEAGMYFAWGETSGYTAEQVGVDKYFIWEDYTDESDVTHHNDYKFGPVDWDDETNYGMTEYNNTDGKTVLEAKDDAATQIWGSDWRMPTKEQFDELISSANTETIFTKQNGVSGLLVTSKVDGYEGNSVFFPAVGDAGYGEVRGVGEYGSCLSVSLSDGDVGSAWRLIFRDGLCKVYYNYRYFGYSVRPVRSK